MELRCPAPGEKRQSPLTEKHNNSINVTSDSLLSYQSYVFTISFDPVALVFAASPKLGHHMNLFAGLCSICITMECKSRVHSISFICTHMEHVLYSLPLFYQAGVNMFCHNVVTLGGRMCWSLQYHTNLTNKILATEYGKQILLIIHELVQQQSTRQSTNSP